MPQGHACFSQEGACKRCCARINGMRARSGAPPRTSLVSEPQAMNSASTDSPTKFFSLTCPASVRTGAQPAASHRRSVLSVEAEHHLAVAQPAHVGHRLAVACASGGMRTKPPLSALLWKREEVQG